ncbi:MAG: M24 family metallopeptidase, partial [Clostridia bacterium]|nr:M24 family metallopeptidase [Clostridia bacterium]
SSVSSAILDAIPACAKVIDKPNPTLLPKACKNETEVSNFRLAHVKDGAAVTKFIYWLKTRVGKEEITELSAAEKLESLRREQENYVEPSFSPIIGFGPHGAIIHYGATPESNVPLAPEGFLLVDSGAHYLECTTDITRTFALGPVTDEMKENFTRVLIGHLNLAYARFPHGVGGYNLDVLARMPWWEESLDYKHGTGHGVGHILSVHEGPNAFRWKSVPGKAETVLEEGMITSDEPGYYLEGQYGVRIESELLCRKADKNEFGQFMYFENLTYVPIDLDAVEPSLLTSRDKARLNAYHASVYEKVSPFLTPAENEILKKYTRAI